MPQYGINLDPDVAAGLPLKPEDLSGMKWIRFVFQAHPHQARSIEQSCQFYLPFIERYHALGIRTLLIINHQTYLGDEPWRTGGSWRQYAVDFSAACGKIAAFFKGRNVAYEIWNEGDQASPSAIYVPPQTFAPLIAAASSAIKAVDPQATVVFGGLVSGDPCGYLQAVASTLGGRLPVDAIGIHPYGKNPSGTNAIIPFLQGIHGSFPSLPLWITEYGDSQVTQARYEVVDYYMRLVDSALRRSMADVVQVAIWYCWSDGMNPGFGITDAKGQPKDKVYSTYFLLNKLNEVLTPAPTTPEPTKPPTQPNEPTTEPETSTPVTEFTHQQLINAIYEAAQAVGDNPWAWFRVSGLSYLTEDRKKIYSGKPIADLPNLTTDQKTLIQRVLNGESLETTNYDNTDDSSGGETPSDDSKNPDTKPDKPTIKIPTEKVLDIQWVSQFDAVGTPNTDCGDACVLMLLWYFRFKTPDARVVFRLLSGTTTAAELVYLANQYDLTLTTEPVDLDRVKQLIANDQPVILLVDYKDLGFPVHLRSGVNQGNHWFVAVGYNASGFVIHDPLWMPAQRNGMGGAYLPIQRATLQKALISYYVMVYHPDE